MKTILTILLLIPIALCATMFQVALDGSQAYSTVQSAVNAAAEQDTILIHPGTYFENIEIIGRHLTIGSLELITSDSTYIAQTVIDGNHSGSCFKITDNSEVWIQGLYMTHGIGSPGPVWDDRIGGAIYVYRGYLSVVNSRIIENTASSGAGIHYYYSSGYLAGTVIAYNRSKSLGSLFVGGPEDTVVFDQYNRCSVYCNYGTRANDISYFGIHEPMPEIYLDVFTVSADSEYLTEYIFVGVYGYGNQIIPYVFDINSAAITPQYADFFVSPDGDDNNTGLSADVPLKTIALALQRIGANSQNPHTLHLANGIYNDEQHFPLNLRSYVSIIGESEEGVIFSGSDTFCIGFDSEKEVTIKNITFQAVTNQAYYNFVLIHCVSRINIDGVLDKFSLHLENLSFRDCQPVHYSNQYVLGEFAYSGELTMRNINVENCMGTLAFLVSGGNLYAENVRIHNFYPPPTGEKGGRALVLHHESSRTSGGDNILNNLQVTGCVSNTIDWNYCPTIGISANYTGSPENYIINSTISDNQALPIFGAGITLDDNANVTFINSIISNNSDHNVILNDEGTSARIRFQNCLLGPSDNLEDTIYNMSPDNIIEWYGTNLSSDPGFYAWSDDNPYTLGQDSPCINAGTIDFGIFTIPDWYELPSYDLAGNPRIYGDQVDLGAYEWQGQTDIEDLVTVPTFSISNYPNPFNPETTITYSLPEATKMRLDIYNLKGQLIKTLVNEAKAAGKYSVVWKGTDDSHHPVSSGIYIYKMSAGKYNSTRRMILMK
ncbi:MAG: FlgD immunoglobulin-like domain containing protein [Kiritimatiellia bacterium]